MYNTPHIRNGGFGALQVEAITNRPLSIARRHLAASQLRMRDIEPDELSSSEWVRFLVMQEYERERWMTDFRRRRRGRAESTASLESDREIAYDKAEEARLEAEEARREAAAAAAAGGEGPSASAVAPTGSTPPASLWARHFDEEDESPVRGRPRAASPEYTPGPLHARRAVTEGFLEAPPTYESVLRARTPPPTYHQSEEGYLSPASP